MDLEVNNLLELAHTGDEAAFLKLYDTWKGNIYRFAWQMTGSIPAAEDLTQEVFLMILKKRIHFQPEKGSFSSFIYGVARNLCLKSIQKDRRFFRILDRFENHKLERQIADPLAGLTGSEAASQLRRCIQSLPTQYREAVVLCDLHELSYAEVASITGSAIGTVRSRLHRGRELLVQKMRAPEPEQKATGGNPHEIAAL